MEADPLTDEFKVYPKRYLVVFLFALAQFMTSCLINTLTPIARFLEVIYDQDPLIVNSGALLFALMYPVFTFPAAYVIDFLETILVIQQLILKLSQRCILLPTN